MNAKSELIQQSQQLLLKKCIKCQNNAEYQSQKQQPLCKLCHEAEIVEPISLVEAEEYYSEQKPSLQNKHLTTLKKAYSMDYQRHSPPKKAKSISRSENSLVQRDDQSEDSESQRLRQQEQQLKQAVRNDNLKLKRDNKVIVGSGFSFDMTDFFKFKKKELGAGEQSFFESITGSRIAWLLLLYTICSTALIPGWIMNIKANKFLRKEWRFLMQALFVIPFALYEKRTATPEQAEKYNFKYIFSPTNIIKPYISSLASSLWFFFILSSFEWTYVAHGIVLGNLSNFFLSIGRSLNKNSHDLESGGQVLVVLGILLVLHDSVSVHQHEIAADSFTYLNNFYLSRTWWERIGGDMVAIFTSFIMSQFSKYTSDLRSYYPPFLSLLMVNSFNVINLTLMAYFFNGATFDFHPYWGAFSIFTDQHFTSFMYMAIVLACGQMVSVFLITKMFPDPIIPAIAMTLQPFLACFFVDVAKIQKLPGNFAMIGFILIFPGMMLVLMGQCFFQRQKSSKDEADQRVKKLMDEIQQLKQKRKERQTHHLSRKPTNVKQLDSILNGKKSNF